MPLTYEQLAPSLYKWANIFACKFNEFERDELVNAVWEIGRIQKLKNIKFASRRAKNDMIDYMRRKTDLRIVRRWEEKGKNYPKKVSLQKMMENKESDKPFQTLQCKTDPGPAEIDTKDLFEQLCKGLDRHDTLILKLMFFEEMNQEEIAKIVGVTESRISQRTANLLLRTRAKLKKLGICGIMPPGHVETEAAKAKREKFAQFLRCRRQLESMKYARLLEREKREQRKLKKRAG
jgi:RNA polymerase sigma factor (sigma-70 family)